MLTLNERPLFLNTEHLKNLGLSEGNLYLGIRPEHIIVKRKQEISLELPARVDQVIDYGRYQQLTLNIGKRQTIKAIVTNNEFKNDDPVYILLSEKRTLFFDHASKKNVDA